MYLVIYPNENIYTMTKIPSCFLENGKKLVNIPKIQSQAGSSFSVLCPLSDEKENKSLEELTGKKLCGPGIICLEKNKHFYPMSELQIRYFLNNVLDNEVFSGKRINALIWDKLLCRKKMTQMV